MFQRRRKRTTQMMINACKYSSVVHGLGQECCLDADRLLDRLLMLGSAILLGSSILVVDVGLAGSAVDAGSAVELDVNADKCIIAICIYHC
ncbi:hypothetical protein Dimus_023153 [Dionaea muscipula]